MGYIAAAVDVACDYAGAAAHVLDAMQQRWAELRLRKDSAAAAVLQAMSTMPATDTAFLREATGRSARAVRRAVRQLADSGALAESVDDVTGRAVFELPEMLQVVDGRVRLVSACWEMRAVGAEPQARALIDRWRDSVAQHAGPRELLPCTHIGARSNPSASAGPGTTLRTATPENRASRRSLLAPRAPRPMAPTRWSASATPT